jgi:cell division protein FtsI (penicillin-binding protein 3)
MLAVGGAFAALLVLVAGRAVDLTVLRGPALAQLAAMQHRLRIELVPHRGPIVERNGETLAISLDVPSVYVRPREFRGQESSLPALAAALKLPVGALGRKTASTQPFVWLKRQAPPREAEAAEALGLRGVDLVSEGRRFYPHGSLAAHVLGFVGIDSQGLEGIERRLDQALRGKPQDLDAYRDARGRQMFTRGVQAPPEQGSRVELTLDAAIQDAAERELARGVSVARAKGGVAVVLDPTTGEVLALANVPTYDPNRPGAVKDRAWRDRVRNRALTDPYEPGSTFKAVLAAAAIEARAVTPRAALFCENGRYRFGGRTIHDTHKYDWLTFAEVIQYSSNIGATKIADRLGRDRYYGYLLAFGFGARTGIELPGESPGILRPASRWSRIDLATHSFGQGVSVTPLQMAAAFGAIANDGLLMRPYLVRRVVTPGGAVTVENKPAVVRRVVSARTAATVTDLLRLAVEGKKATGERARLEGYAVAGKTGTAQKVDPKTGAYSSARIGSFVGFVPADRPRVVILVLIDEPRTSSYGGTVAAPVFRALAAAALQRLGVPPAPPTATVASASRSRPRPRVRRASGVPDGTPNLLGLSRREALARAEADGWKVDVSGFGYVVGQVPLPGEPPAGDRRLALTLGLEPTTAAP